MKNMNSLKMPALNDKSIIIILRFLVILVTFFLTIYDFRQDIRPAVLTLVFGLFLLSDFVLIFVPRFVFTMKGLRNGIFLLDVILISCVIYLTGGL